MGERNETRYSGEPSEENIRQWIAGFQRLPLKDARAVTRTWISRVGRPTGGLDDLDREDLCRRALEARREFFASPGCRHRHALDELDGAAEQILFARRLLEDTDVDVSNLLGDSVGLLTEVARRLGSEPARSAIAARARQITDSGQGDASGVGERGGGRE